MEKTEWIKSEKRMPPKGEDVLVCDMYGILEVKYYVPKSGNYCWGWYPGGLPIGNSYWMYLPKKPQV